MVAPGHGTPRTERTAKVSHWNRIDETVYRWIPALLSVDAGLSFDPQSNTEGFCLISLVTPLTSVNTFLTWPSMDANLSSSFGSDSSARLRLFFSEAISGI